jgi:hypothetical protein
MGEHTVTDRNTSTAALAALAALGVAAVVAGRQAARSARPGAAATAHRTPPGHVNVQAARSCSRSAALLALSVCADSAMEHYRGSFNNAAMYAPPVASLLALAASMHGSQDTHPHRHGLRDTVFSAAGATGLAGTAFHLFNVMKRPGGVSWHNLFYAAPIGAPAALLLAGLLGSCAERLRDGSMPQPVLFGLPAAQALALAAGLGLAGTACEAALLHFRGAFQHRAMYAPVIVPPIASALLLNAALRPSPDPWFTRLWLRVTALLGYAGVAFHARGIARYHGGWLAWSQNLYNGPPLPAPPSFSALALAGLAALRLREAKK